MYLHGVYFTYSVEEGQNSIENDLFTLPCPRGYRVWGGPVGVGHRRDLTNHKEKKRRQWSTGPPICNRRPATQTSKLIVKHKAQTICVLTRIFSYSFLHGTIWW